MLPCQGSALLTKQRTRSLILPTSTSPTIPWRPLGNAIDHLRREEIGFNAHSTEYLRSWKTIASIALWELACASWHTGSSPEFICPLSPSRETAFIVRVVHKTALSRAAWNKYMHVFTARACHAAIQSQNIVQDSSTERSLLDPITCLPEVDNLLEASGDSLKYLDLWARI